MKGINDDHQHTQQPQRCQRTNDVATTMIHSSSSLSFNNYKVSTPTASILTHPTEATPPPPTALRLAASTGYVQLDATTRNANENARKRHQPCTTTSAHDNEDQRQQARTNDNERKRQRARMTKNANNTITSFFLHSPSSLFATPSPSLSAYHCLPFPLCLPLPPPSLLADHSLPPPFLLTTPSPLPSC